MTIKCENISKFSFTLKKIQKNPKKNNSSRETTTTTTIIKKKKKKYFFFDFLVGVAMMLCLIRTIKRFVLRKLLEIKTKPHFREIIITFNITYFFF